MYCWNKRRRTDMLLMGAPAIGPSPPAEGAPATATITTRGGSGGGSGSGSGSGVPADPTSTSADPRDELRRLACEVQPLDNVVSFKVDYVSRILKTVYFPRVISKRNIQCSLFIELYCNLIGYNM